MNYKLQLYDLAQQCRSNAYAPYSKFKVGAAIRSADCFYAGCNVENVSYPCGTCAEAGAIAAMVADGKYTIDEIMIVADTDNILPCGNCLQKIAEFGNKETLIHSADINGHIHTYKLEQLLPNVFTAKEIINA